MKTCKNAKNCEWGSRDRPNQCAFKNNMIEYDQCPKVKKNLENILLTKISRRIEEEMMSYDICLCANADNCPNKNDCLRATYKPPKNTPYSISFFYNERFRGRCEYFIPTEKEK